MDPFRERRLQPEGRLLPGRPSGPVAPGLDPRPAAELLHLERDRRRGHDAALLRQQPAGLPGRVRGVRRRGPRCVRHRARVPVRLRRARAVLRVGRGDAAGPDRAHGPKGAGVLRRLRGARAAGADDQGHPRRRLPAAGERDPPASRHGGPDLGLVLAALPAGAGMHVLRLLRAGLPLTARRAAQPRRQALDRQQLRADGRDRERVVLGRSRRDAGDRRVRHAGPHRGA